jgi:apolipoprotein N-acyltransferase
MARRGNFALAVASGLFLGFSFPPVPLGFLAFVGFIPLLFLLDRVEIGSPALRYSYVSFLVFNVVTLYWVGGFTHGRDVFLMIGGAALLIIHPLFFLVPIVAYLLVKKYLGGRFALLMFAFLWVSFEWIHSLGQLGFPWLTVGNSQSMDIAHIQFITLTGVYGISFWIVSVNALLYFLLRKLTQAEWALKSPRAALTFALTIAILLIPVIHGKAVLSESSQIKHQSPVRIGVLQPDLDPWKKWEVGHQEQLETYIGLSRPLVEKQPHLVLWPETAIAFRILTPKYAPVHEELRNWVDGTGCGLLTGFADITFYDSADAPRGSHTVQGTTIHYEDFNAIMLLEPRSARVQKYAKMRLVPFGERVPYAEHLTFLADAVKWDVGISGWGIGRDTTVFTMMSGERQVKFSAMVCYESIYPELVSRFVKKGAEFLVVITNDSWYGKTSGPYQHAYYAALRAIENRRPVVRCANGGISCFIDPYGRISQATELFTQASIVGETEPSNENTFYSTQGDLFARVCTVVATLALLGAFIGKFTRRTRLKEKP